MPQVIERPADLALEISGAAQDVKSFRSSLERRFAEQSARLDALDRAALSRAPLERGAAAQTPHSKAVAAYLRSGDASGLIETKALSGASDADGGYLLDPQTSDGVASLLRGAGSLRSAANVVQVEASSYDVLIDHTEMDAGWRAETANAAETSTPSLDRISIALHELSAQPKVSQRLLEDAAFDLETWLSERIAERFMLAESAAFITGDGVDKPRGVLNHATVAQSSWSWGSLGYVATGENGSFPSANPADALIDLVYALGARYRSRARFVMNSNTAGVIRKFKDLEGRYLWSEPVVEGQAPMLFGYPVLICEDMPDIASGADAVAFGDFQSGYTIAERPDLRILRDPYSLKPHVLFYASKRVGGDVSDFAAIKLLKFAAS